MSLRYLLPLCSLAITVFTGSVSADSGCRNQPGDPGFPSTTEWAALNSTVDGRLLAVVPSAKYCEDLPCTETQWFSSVFRATIPGGTDFVRLDLVCFYTEVANVVAQSTTGSR